MYIKVGNSSYQGHQKDLGCGGHTLAGVCGSFSPQNLNELDALYCILVYISEAFYLQK